MNYYTGDKIAIDPDFLQYWKLSEKLNDLNTMKDYHFWQN